MVVAGIIVAGMLGLGVRAVRAYNGGVSSFVHISWIKAFRAGGPNNLPYTVIAVDQTPTGTRPTCSSTYPTRFTIPGTITSANTVAGGVANPGSDLLNLATAAMLSGKRVDIEGTNSCPEVATIEGVSALTLEQQ